MSNVAEKLNLKGDLKIVLTDKYGNVKDERDIKNLVVTTGLNFIVDRMAGTGSNIMSHMAVGTGSTAVAAGDTTLETELARVALDSDNTSTNTITYIATFPAGTGTGAITEAGVLNAASSGDLLSHTVFSVVNKAADDVMTINWTITLNAV